MTALQHAFAVLALCSSLAACDAAVEPARANGPHSDDALFDPSAPFARPRFCERPKDDAVRDLFCAEPLVPVRSLRQLALRLDLKSLPDDADDKAAASLSLTPDELVDFVVYLGHSTALSGQLVSSINPRVLQLGASTFLAYQRGVQQVEVITTDRTDGGLNFYLVSFAQRCNAQAQGCSFGDVYTQGVERDWTDVVVRDDEELKNTPLDCRQCHQRGRDRPALLMRELRGPWTHFFASFSEQYQPSDEVSGADLSRDFLAAKETEAYAALPAALSRHTAGLSLQLRVGGDQPLNFESELIAAELRAAKAAGTPLRSAYWDAAYQSFKRGERLAPPYFEQRATDPDKLRKLSDAYVRYRRGELEKDALPDLSDIYPDDPQTRAEIGLQTEPGASGPDLLIQACGACHNDVLDQTLSRARFNIALATMSRAELELAIARIQLSPDHAGAMPPALTRQLDAAGRKRLIAYLRSERRPSADDALLARAAMLGMANDPYGALGQ